MMPVHDQTRLSSKIELAMIGPLIVFPNESYIFVDKAISEGFSSDYFKCRKCKLAWDYFLKMENKITTEIFWDYLYNSEVIAQSMVERSLWISEVACFGMYCEIPIHAKMISESFFREKTISDISELSNHSGNSEDIILSMEEKVAEIQSQRFNEIKDQKFSAIEQLSERMDAIIDGKKTRMINTGIPVWEETIGGLPENQIITISGRPGNGKTSLAEQIIDNLVRDKVPVLYIQKELSKERALGRIACKKIKIPWSLFEKFKASREQALKLKAEVQVYDPLPLFMEPVSKCDSANLRSTIKFYIKHHGIKLVVIDHLKLIHFTNQNDIRLAITEVMKMFRDLTNENQISVICVSQLSRNSEKNKARPTKADLAESGSIEDFSDSILALWNSEDRDGKSMWPVNWYVMKNRFGAEGEVQVLYDGANMTFMGKIKNENK